MLICVTIIVNDKEAVNLIGVREDAEGVGGGRRGRKDVNMVLI